MFTWSLDCNYVAIATPGLQRHVQHLDERRRRAYGTPWIPTFARSLGAPGCGVLRRNKSAFDSPNGVYPPPYKAFVGHDNYSSRAGADFEAPSAIAKDAPMAY